MEFLDQENETMTLLSSLLTSDFSLISSSTDHPQQQDPDDGGKKGEVKKKKRNRKRKKGKREGEALKKRRLNDEQVRFLDMSFGNEKRLESGRKVRLAAQAGLDPKQVAVWFQNKRARWKRKQMEDDYLKLKSDLQAAIVHKCRLEAEVLNLNQKLAEAETKIRKISTGSNSDGVSGVEMISSPNTSFSIDCQPFPGVEEQIGFTNEHNYVNMLDWVDLCGM